MRIARIKKCVHMSVNAARMSACATIVAVCLMAQALPSLHGVITDPSGASVPGAIVQVLGPGGEQRTKTDNLGKYAFASLPQGAYRVRVIGKGFSVTEKTDVNVSGATEFNAQLVIEAETQVVNVEDEANRVSTDPGSNGTSLVLREKELAALSDDPDELLSELQAMAGPGAGPNGGQIYIDGFTGGNMPPKSSIREVRINSNPFSAEYDRPGFGRIEILTKPGTDKIHVQVFGQFNKEIFNSRSPLLRQSTRPPYEQRFFGFNVGGPIKANKASYNFNLERRSIDENAFILATTLDSNLNLVNVNEAVVTPRVLTNFSPRIDYTINSNNTLVLRYHHFSNSFDKQGIGGFSLPSRAYNSTSSENTVQVTETAILSTKAVNETRFQYTRSALANSGDNTLPSISVQGAFSGGGAQIGNSANTRNGWEVTNLTTYTRGTQVLRWGGRLRQSFIDDTSVNNFGGSYIFFGGTGPMLDASNQPIPGTSIDLTALERYRRTLLFQQMGLTGPAIRLAGGGASQFNLSAGVPALSVNQFDVGLFVNNDWRARPNLTVSYGLRYETQTNIHDFGDWAPRLGVAWGIGGTATKPAKTVLRAGGGIFYDRISDSLTLLSDRFNGITQQSYFILNPDFFPIIPSPASLASGQQPQQLQILYRDIRAPRTYQLSAGLDRQINKYIRFSAQYIDSRGVHLQRLRNINAPIAGLFPFGDRQLRELTESTGFSRIHQIVFSPNVNYKKLFLFGFYGISYGKDDNGGQPADPYNLRAEWGPSAFGDVRHRVVVGTNLPLLWKINISPFMMASSGSPYNITTGRDTNGDGAATERPALVSGIAASDCHTGNLVYATGFGCFNLAPTPGSATIGRNFARGPAIVSLNARIARTWAFGNKGETNAGPGGPGGNYQIKAGAGPPPGGGERGGGGGGPMLIMMGGPGGGAANKKYNITLSASASNVLNHANFANPVGDLSSPYFGQSLSLAGGFGPLGGASTYNRKIDFQLRFGF